MKLNSHNEWDKLREVVVGTVEGWRYVPCSAREPVSDAVMERVAKLAREAFPQWMEDEVNEDLQELCDVLKRCDVKVLRPNSANVGKPYATPDWTATGDMAYNMRDLHLVVGDTVLESPSQERHRLFESTALYDIWYRYFEEGFRWINAPKPRLVGDYMISYEEDGHRHQKLTESEIVFEAANVVRMGKDLLYLVSRSGNHLGAKWIQSVVGDDYQVHTTSDIYRASHIDSTVMCLRPGLVLLNASRVNEKNCPPIFDTWDKIYFSEIVPTPAKTMEFHEQTRKRVHRELAQIGIDTDLDHVASDWIGMNFLSVDPEALIIDERQSALIKTLERHKLRPIPISFRHSHLLKGGIHCCTLDTVRESKLESYFGDVRGRE